MVVVARLVVVGRAVVVVDCAKNGLMVVVVVAPDPVLQMTFVA